MKKIILIISLLITISNITFARERIKNDPNAHIKPTYPTEIESIEIAPTVIHMSETEEVVIYETQVVVPEVEQAFVDNKIYSKNDLPNVGYTYKDTDDPKNAEVEAIQGVTSLFSLIPITSGIRITYNSNINGWAEFDITYKTIRGDYTNTVVKPIAKGLNILTLSASQNDTVTYFKSENVYCSAIRRVVMPD